MKYPIAPDDDKRVSFIKELAILDNAPNENLDRVVALCREIFDVPIANISIVSDNREWFMSRAGQESEDERRDVALCNFTIVGTDIYEVPNTLEHPEISKSPLVTEDPGIRYYAGAPIQYDQFNLGALCLIDLKPRPPMDEQARKIFKALSEMVTREIRIRRILKEALAVIAEREIAAESN